MASPVTQTIPTSGNLYAATSLAASANIGVFIDLTAVFEGDIDVRETTGATAASTSGVSVNAYHVYATTTTATTFTGGSTTSFTAASATGFGKGMLVALVNPSTLVGELVTVSNVSGTTITLSAAPANSYSGTTNIYFVSQTPAVVGATLGQNLTSANTTYGATLFLQTAAYFLSLKNLDASNAVTAEITGRNITAVQ